MRLQLTLNSSDYFTLPVEHNHIIQSFIYRSISDELAKNLHDIGFEINNRRFRLFTFSRIMGQYSLNRQKREITFKPPVNLVVSSAISQFAEELGNEMLRRENIRIGRNSVFVESVEVSNFKFQKNRYKIKMLSPMTIYSTLSKANGKKKTYYYTPFENEFSELISANAVKKYESLYKKNINGNITLSGHYVSNSNLKIINYKGTIIKGWMGIYELSGNPELMSLVYDTGLGGKNAQGFGCFEVLV